jgi:3-hydroxybutyryl-CoA dehydrogenase
MNIDDIKQITVVGAGTMGSQIALQCALSGYEVNLTDADEAALAKGMASDQQLVQQRVTKGRITAEAAERGLSHLHAVANLEEAARTADFVIEAAFENLAVKRDIFARLDQVCPPHTILASNSSSIVISKIVEDNIARKDKALNFHFFHPATVMKLVEVGKGPDTSDETAQIGMELARHIGKEPVLVQKEIFGFIVNYVLSALSRAAFDLYEGGYASYEDIDKALKLGLNHPMGPFELADFSGIDIAYGVMRARYAETGDPADLPSPTVERMVQEGHLGRKTGKGFYDYTPKPTE